MLKKNKSIFSSFHSTDSMTRKISKNMLLSGICKPLSLILSYIYVPIVLNYLDVEKYGVWSTILSILSWIGYADIGIGNGLRNKLTESITQHDNERSRHLISSAYAIIAIIMFVFAIVLCIVFSLLNWNKIFGVNDIHENLKLIVCMSVCFVAINFIFSICNNILFALQEAAIVSYLSLATQVLNLVGVILLASFTRCNLFLLALVYGCSMIFVQVFANLFLFLNKYKYLRPSISYVDKKTGFDLTTLGIQFFVIQVCALVLFTTDSLIISNLYGAADVTPYSMVNKVFSAIVNVFMAFLTPIWSSVTMAKTQGNYKWLRKLLHHLQLLMIPFALGTVIAGVIFRPLTSWWLGRTLQYSSNLIWLGVVYCLLNIWCNTYSSFANGLQIMNVQMIIAVIQASVNIPLSVFFAKCLNMQIAGVLLGTDVSMAIGAVAEPIITELAFRKGEKQFTSRT